MKYKASEIRRRKGESFFDSVRHILNNFHLRFPLKDGYYRSLIQESGNWEVTSRRGGYDEPSSWPFSEMFLSQTPKEFYAELDRTVKEVGMTNAQVLAGIEEFENSRAKGADYEKLWNLLIPIFVAMRKKGYERGELCR